MSRLIVCRRRFRNRSSAIREISSANCSRWRRVRSVVMIVHALYGV
jgi:hypothetical protein